MTPSTLRALLADVAAGTVAPDDAVERLRSFPFADIGSARIDHHRELRVGVPEVVFAEGKTNEQVRATSREIMDGSGRCLITRLSPEAAAAVAPELPGLDYDEASRTGRLGEPLAQQPGHVVVATGGTSDHAVAAEALRTLEFLGVEALAIRDVGVAGLHRLLAEKQTLDAASVVIAVAGMEGALATAVAGLVRAPVIAVPTSVGYGASFGGLAALLAMMNSCAPGVAVVNIDNGFGAAVMARQILATAGRIAPNSAT
ncbi:MAG: NCAIR mutase (PurE)-related protein [Hyphomicrobiaceae bacterium]|jgi:NCAIR mutase (PurE)-related protein